MSVRVVLPVQSKCHAMHTERSVMPTTCYLKYCPAELILGSTAVRLRTFLSKTGQRHLLIAQPFAETAFDCGHFSPGEVANQLQYDSRGHTSQRWQQEAKTARRLRGTRASCRSGGHARPVAVKARGSHCRAIDRLGRYRKAWLHAASGSRTRHSRSN
jgi:hypothetical protein